MTVNPVIHVGIDASWRDTGALEWALQESRLRHLPLRVVHVIEEKLRHAPYWEPTVIDDAALNLIHDVQQRLEAETGSLDHEADLMVGPPARTLAETAAGSRMIVVGRRGVGTFKRLLIGSTSEAVSTEAAVPVVVVPEGWKPSDHSGPVLVAVDDTGNNGAALEFAAAEALNRGLKLRLIHVWDLPAMYSWDAMNVAGVDAEWSENARRHVELLAGQWQEKYPGLTVEAEVRRGHVIDGIVTAAQDCDTQLLVTGSRGHGRVVSALLGSVARGVLHHAPCPIAVIHSTPDGS